MFGSNARLPDRVLSFEAALAKYNSITPIRGRRDQNTRPLVSRKSDTLTIRVDNPEDPRSVIFRLYSTDVVTYNIDGTIDLDPYPSRMTNMMVWSLLGRQVCTYWASRYRGVPNHVTQVGTRYYNTPEFCTIDTLTPSGEWQVVGGSKPFTVPQIDRAKAKQALLDTDFYSFKLWLDTQIRIGLDPRSNKFYWKTSANNWAPHSTVRMLQDGTTGWTEMVSEMSGRCSLKTELDAIRQAVYKYADVYDTVEVPYFEDYREMQNALKTMRRYK